MKKQRSCRGGGQIAELAPAIFLILIVLVFPIVEFLYLGSAYCFGWYLNYLVVRETAQYAPDNVTGRKNAVKAITDQWKSGLGKFTGSDAENVEPPEYRPNATNPETVNVITRVLVSPFVRIAFFAGVPGLGAPVLFVYNQRATQEERGLN